VTTETLAAVFSIIVIDLVLSGDNAVVIGMAARRLSPENRRRAIIYGGAGAVGLRILFTAMAALLLDTPYLQLIGGVLLFWIAWRLLKPGGGHGHVAEAGTLGEAIRTIVLADVVMSLDNILAVGGAAHGDLSLLLFGLVLSIPILLLGSELVARLLGRYPGLLYLGVLVLIHTALTMIFEDPFVHDRVAAPPTIALWAAAGLLTLGIAAVSNRIRRVDAVPIDAVVEAEAAGAHATAEVLTGAADRR
jgi:YjbE family integral membrane protein